ncbi:MAG: sel1 repeat family protein [Myxococcales bacterium]|nr:sel1 repeat family protein [Myxococcales bacterium]
MTNLLRRTPLFFCAALGLGLALSWAGSAAANQPATPPPPETCTDAKDCLNKGARAHQGKDFVRAARFLPTACEIEPKACNIVAEIFRQGQGGVPKDGNKAAEFHGKACDKGLIVSCAIEAQLRYHGQDGATVNKPRARIGFERSCGPDFFDSCANVGVMHATGDGGPQDLAKARLYYQKACDGGESTACVNLAAMLLNGEGGDADKPKAKAMFTDFCGKKNALSCFNLGLIYAKGLEGAQDLTQALSFLDQSCTLGNQQGCTTAQQIRDDQAKIAAEAAAAAAKKAGKGKRK